MSAPTGRLPFAVISISSEPLERGQRMRCCSITIVMGKAQTMTRSTGAVPPLRHRAVSHADAATWPSTAHAAHLTTSRPSLWLASISSLPEPLRPSWAAVSRCADAAQLHPDETALPTHRAAHSACGDQRGYSPAGHGAGSPHCATELVRCAECERRLKRLAVESSPDEHQQRLPHLAWLPLLSG